MGAGEEAFLHGGRWRGPGPGREREASKDGAGGAGLGWGRPRPEAAHDPPHTRPRPPRPRPSWPPRPLRPSQQGGAEGRPRAAAPELLYALARMGHGDEIVLEDVNFPTTSICRCGPEEIPAYGLGIPQHLEAVLQLLPLDSYVESPGGGPLRKPHPREGVLAPDALFQAC
ncbi:fucose mutarotase [Mesoplodon densirostris]|uniref:fucose mutarotase n=1 Tax=Mesoplodon densirostris TaxID=48708 RepID=UPI0028DB65B6|nr:fucose mutarotase [Mesoplodon densirostris]